MKYTVATFVSLVAAAAAAPSARQAGAAVSQGNQKKLAGYENQCPQVNINCCVPVNPENVPPQGQTQAQGQAAAGIVGVIPQLLDSLVTIIVPSNGGEATKQYCSPTSNGADLTADLLGALMGTSVTPDTTHLCDVNGDINVACCPNQGNGDDSSSSCTFLGTISNGDPSKPKPPKGH